MTENQRRFLRMIFERGAESASVALSRWLGQEAKLAVNEVASMEMAEAAAVLGPQEMLVAACEMEVSGPLDGRLLLIFKDSEGLMLVDVLMDQPLGTTSSWGELEQSAALETCNIVGCAYLNALAAHLPGGISKGLDGGLTAEQELVPSPPRFLREFAGSLLEFALMEQAIEHEELLLVRTSFASGREELVLSWTLLFVPDNETLRRLTGALSELEER